MVDLTTRIGPLRFKNPITVASGTFGVKDEYADYVDYRKLGAVIAKTITLHPRKGNPMPRICETPAGMLNAIGLQNKGLRDFVEDKIPYFRKRKIPLIVNIAGESTKEFGILAKELDRYKKSIAALELNLSCPNIEAGGVRAIREGRLITKTIEAVRKETQLFIFAKLSPELGDVLETAKEAIRAGADGLSLINTIRGMAIHIESRKPRLAVGTGGLSGPAIRPIALRYVYEIKQALPRVSVIASGGITTWQDAVEFLIAGADLLAIGTANFVNPRATLDILEGLKEYCLKHHIKRIGEIRGSLVTHRRS
ncbi:MAG: dihydroorotate dehydrogenase [Candidatus Omnitrophica bacterium]|nr:dihydroorotate dehydrogenase [Candidatus Omnitrophota bacterium]